MTPDDAQVQPEVTESAVVTPAPEPTLEQTATEGTTEAAAEWTPDSLPRDDQGRFSKWAEKAKAEFHRQEITRAGNWIANLPPEDRERIKKDPLLLRRMEAQLEEARRAADAKYVAGPTNGTQKPQPEVDDAESDAREFLSSEGWTGEEDGYKAMLRHETARIKFLDKRSARRTPAFDPEKATDDIAGRLSQKQFHSKLLSVKESSEWNDETLKGATFQGEFKRRGDRLLAEGKTFDPEKLASEVRDVVFPTSAVASRPKPKPSFGDQSSGKVSASAESDPLDEYNKRLRASGRDPNNW